MMERKKWLERYVINKVFIDMKKIIKDYQLLIGSLVVASAILYSNESTNYYLEKIWYELNILGFDIVEVATAVELINEKMR